MVYPDYYPEFSCIAGACKHSCCIGWEIDVDEEALARFSKVEGELGQRLQENISMEDVPHFKLKEGERCPFLNGDGLCDLILELGEETLCEICEKHPRFYNWFADHTEVGLGLCCEEAGRLILSRTEPVHLTGDLPEEPDGMFLLREELFGIAQDRSKPISRRAEGLLAYVGAVLPGKSTAEWADFLLHLERLDEAWTERLERLKEPVDLDGFDTYMAARQTEYEQFLVYLLYRHLSEAVDPFDLAGRTAFAVWGYELLRKLGAAVWTDAGAFSFEEQVELARLFSSELEYSDENLDLILEQLY